MLLGNMSWIARRDSRWTIQVLCDTVADSQSDISVAQITQMAGLLYP